MTKIYLSFLVALLACVTNSAAQNPDGRLALGFHSGTNVWLNDFNERKVGPGGEIFLRYGLSRYFSLGIVAGYEELKSKQDPPFGFLPYDYIKLHSLPASLVGWIHLAPGSTFSPFIYFGGGGIFFKRQDGNKVYRPDKVQTSYVVPAGIGFEAFTSSRVSITLDLGFRAMNDKTEGHIFKRVDSYATAKAGINIYFGSSDSDDDDGDRLTNAEERRLGTNPGNPDSDGDGLKDGEEVRRYRTNPLNPDTDGDGLSDGDEVFRYGTDPTKADTDGDGLTDYDEIIRYKTDPMKLDTDGDGLTDGDEVLKYRTDPLKVDTDGDGLADWDEVMVHKTDPLRADTDGDGLSDGDEITKHRTDPLKADTDGGGVTDAAEIQRGTDPLNPKDDIVKETIVLERGRTVILEGVNFATGSATLTRDSERTLEKAFIALVANPEVRVEIAGYTDNVGSARVNDALSLRRAQAVKSWLARKGIDARRMTTVGMGMRDPIAPNDTPEGRAQNRRIEFHVLK